MPTASHLLRIYSLRVSMGRDGITNVRPSVLAEMESLVEKLRSLPPDEDVTIDADQDKIPIGKFIRSTTGELLGELGADGISE